VNITQLKAKIDESNKVKIN